MASFNSPEYKYINGSVIANNVKNQLSSYFDQGVLDDSLLYKPLKSCLDRIGLKVMPQRSATIVITDKQGILPKDFYKMVYAIGCSTYEQWENPMNGPEGYKLTLTEKAVVSIPVCKSSLDFCTDECGQLTEILQEFDIYKARYTNVFNVAVSKSESLCTDDLLRNNPGSPNEIAIRNGAIYANFSGYVYIEYLSNLMGDDDEILVPDYTQITDWMETAMMIECFEKMYLNGEGDVIQRLQYLQNIVQNKFQVARTFYKMIEVRDCYDIARVLRSRFQKYRNAFKPQYHNRYFINYDTNNLV